MMILFYFCGVHSFRRYSTHLLPVCIVLLSSGVIAGTPLPYNSMQDAQDSMEARSRDICDMAYRFSFLHPDSPVVGMYRDSYGENRVKPEGTMIWQEHALSYEVGGGMVCQEEEPDGNYHPILYSGQYYYNQQELFASLQRVSDAQVYNFSPVLGLRQLGQVSTVFLKVACKKLVGSRFALPEELQLILVAFYVNERKKHSFKIEDEVFGAYVERIEQSLSEAMKEEKDLKPFEQKRAGAVSIPAPLKDNAMIEPYIQVWEGQ